MKGKVTNHHTAISKPAHPPFQIGGDVAHWGGLYDGGDDGGGDDGDGLAGAGEERLLAAQTADAAPTTVVRQTQNISVSHNWSIFHSCDIFSR